MINFLKEIFFLKKCGRPLSPSQLKEMAKRGIVGTQSTLRPPSPSQLKEMAKNIRPPSPSQLKEMAKNTK